MQQRTTPSFTQTPHASGETAHAAQSASAKVAASVAEAVRKPKDKIATGLQMISVVTLLGTFLLLPLFFVPVSFAPFSYSKVIFVVIGVMLSLIFYSLSVLRTGQITYSSPLTIGAVWLVPISALVSALLSGDVRDAMIAETFGAQTALFVTMLALVMTSVTLVLNQRHLVMRYYLLLLAVVGLIALYHILRIFFGPILSFGVFTNQVGTPLGDWNDLGLFFGMVVLLILVALEQLPLTKWAQVTLASMAGASLLILMTVNFFSVWVIVGLAGLITLIYSLSKQRFQQSSSVSSENTTSLYSIVVSLVVFLVSFVFVVGGTAVGSLVSNATGISFVEVRPSITATADIAREVYTNDNFLTGIGANKFVDAWRLYKDPGINQSVFWNTDFVAGSGYVPTLFVTTGILGVVAWLVFFFVVLRAGVRSLFYSNASDHMQFFIATSSFVAAVFLWGVSFVYVPSETMLILTAFFTGIVFVSRGLLDPGIARTLAFGTDRRTGFMLVAGVMVVIISAVSTLYFTGRHYAATYVYAQSISSIAEGVSLEEIERGIGNAYNLSASDTFARQVAQYQIARINALLQVPEPTADQQQQFQLALTNGINAVNLAVEADPTDASNWGVAAAMYQVIARAGVDGAYDQAKSRYREARQRDPHNPVYVLGEAQLESFNGNLGSARELATEAIQMRPNFIEAINFLAQVDVAEGNITGAIEATTAAARLEPNNASRFYQLGVLYSSNQELDSAISAFERAVTLDPNFANALYFLSLAYAEQGRNDDALVQMRKVAELNPDNQDVALLVAQLESGQDITETVNADAVVEEASEVIVDGESVATESFPDTDLVTPLNPGAATGEDSDEVQDTAVSEGEDAAADLIVDGVDSENGETEAEAVETTENTDTVE